MEMAYHVIELALLIALAVPVLSNLPKLQDRDRRSSWDESFQQCKGQSMTMLKESIFSDITVRDSVMGQLPEGQSAWIGGRTQLSPFMAWVGCTNRVSGTAIKLSKNNLYNCYAACENNTRSYIGLRKDDCFCKNYDLRDFVEDQFCNLTCSDSNMRESCGSANYTAVYIVSDIYVKKYVAMPEELDKKQCLLITNKDKKGLKATSEHCFISTGIHGYLCTPSQLHRDMTCLDGEIMTDVRKPCLFPLLGPSKNSWETADQQCRMKNGRLADLLHRLLDAAIGLQMSAWTGLFRTMKSPAHWTDNPFPIRGEDEHEAACILVTKVLTSLRINTDSCKNQHAFFCEQKITDGTRTALTTVGSSPDSTIKGSESTETPIGNGGSNTTKPSFNYIYLIIALVCLLVIVIFIVIVVYIRVRMNRRNGVPKNNSVIQASMIPNETSPDDVHVDDEDGDKTYYSSVDDTYTGGGIKIQSYNQNSGEGINVLGNNTNSEDYDRIDLKRTGTPNQKRPPVVNNEECHIYDHTVPGDRSDYDMVGWTSGNKGPSTRGIKNNAQDDDVYNHI